MAEETKTPETTGQPETKIPESSPAVPEQSKGLLNLEDSPDVAPEEPKTKPVEADDEPVAWYNRFKGDIDVSKLSKFKEEKDLAKGYIELEKAYSAKMAKEGYVKIPGEDASEDEMAAFKKAVGVPEKPDGYTLPEGVNEENIQNKEFFDSFREFAQKHNVTDKVFKDIVSFYIQQEKGQVEDARLGVIRQREEALKNLSGTYGDDLDSVLAKASLVAKRLEVDGFFKEHADDYRVIRILDHIGDYMGESSLEISKLGLTEPDVDSKIEDIRAKLDTARRGTPQHQELYNQLEALYARKVGMRRRT